MPKILQLTTLWGNKNETKDYLIGYSIKKTGRWSKSYRLCGFCFKIPDASAGQILDRMRFTYWAITGYAAVIVKISCREAHFRGIVFGWRSELKQWTHWERKSVEGIHQCHRGWLLAFTVIAERCTAIAGICSTSYRMSQICLSRKSWIS